MLVRRWVFYIFALLLLWACVANAQTAESSRKVKTKVVPVEPELARKLKLVATVKIQVTIAPNGAVQQAKPLGGHPLLVAPSLEAAKQFRYEPGDGTTTAVIEFHFGVEN
jgi:hypothetical protein